MKNQCIFKILAIGVFLSGVGCATRSTPPAPVVSGSQVSPYAVIPAATSVPTPPPPVAKPPKLQAVASDDDIQAKPITASNTAAAAKPSADNADDSGWQKPTDGKLGVYSVSGKGVNISGVEGQAIYAVASGKVLYSGNGLKGYGNLIIIRHDNIYLSAYAYNKVNLVKEGATVQKGQKIATMGVNGSNQAMLHLEVRKNGKPIDPHVMIGD